MAYIDDTLWLDAKQIAKQNGLANNWVEIVEYYHSTGGHRAIVHSIIDDVQREILNILDDETVLLINSEGSLCVMPYDDVVSSKKLFFYKASEEYNEVSLSIPDGMTYAGKNTVSIKVV